MADEFWSKWKREYFVTTSMQVNDKGIVKKDNLPRNNWRLGKIVKVYTDKDDHVKKVNVSDMNLDKKGKRFHVDRPIHKLILLLKASSDAQNAKDNEGAIKCSDT